MRARSFARLIDLFNTRTARERTTHIYTQIACFIIIELSASARERSPDRVRRSSTAHIERTT